MAKLSSRELKVRKQAQAAKAAQKVTTRATAPKSSSPWGSAGDAISGEGNMTNAQYENKIAQGLGAKTAALARTEAKLTSSPSKQREAASKAYKKPKSTGPSSSVQAAEASGLLGTQSSEKFMDNMSGESASGTGIQGSIKRGLGSASSFFGDIGRMWGANGLAQAAPGVGSTPDELAQNRRDIMGIPSANASDGDISRLGMALQKGSTPDIPTAPGQSDVNDIFGNLGQPTPTSPFQPTGYQSSGVSDGNSGNSDDNSNNGKKKPWVNPWGDVDISGESSPQPSYSDTQNEQYGGAPQPDVAPGRVKTSPYGSGQFGTGKGVQSDDPYIKELRKAYSSNGGEKWLRKQFEELIAALDPTYAQMQKEGTDALNAQLNNQNVQLASVMNANNVGDSEQRAQLMAGQQRDSQTALGNLLAKLSQNKAQDVSGYRSQMAEAMSKYKQNEQQDARTLLEKLQAYRGQQGQSAGRVASPAVQSTQKLSRNDVFSWVEDALGKGYSWQEIADNAQEQGIGTETDGYLDQLLRNANKQNRFAR